MRLLPVDRRSRHELVPARGEAEKANDGDLVLCQLVKERRHGLKTAQIVEVVGDASAPGAGSLIALYSHGVPQGSRKPSSARPTRSRPPRWPAARISVTCP